MVFVSWGLPCFAQESLTKLNQPRPLIQVSSAKLGLTDAKELEAFSDRFFAQFVGTKIPGAVFVVVKDGKIFFDKGYGYANLEQKTPVIPDKTLFRLGSISKVFAATAVMQLAESGKLNLNEDINQYLKQFQIQNNQLKPITAAHLLTHTDGFDVGWTVGAATRCQSQLPSLEEFLSKNLPPRVRQPGEMYVYGDVGIALAGYLVEVLSKIPFTQYIDQNIFKPLNMRHSSFQQPLPAALAADLAVGYDYRNGAYVKTPFACAKSVPSIAMSATATDIAHAIAQLQQGRYKDTRILQETTVQEMQRQHFTNFPNRNDIAGSAYGFYERFQNNQRALEHGGSIYGYTSQMFLLPEQNLGFFVAFNHDDKVNIRENLITQFLDHYYPQQKSNTLLSKNYTDAQSQQRLQQIDGTYRFIRYPQHSLVKLWAILFSPRPDLRLKTDNNGTVTLLPRGTLWREIEPWLLQYENDNNYLYFRRDAQEKIATMSLSNYVFVTYEKLAWYETITLQKLLLGFDSLIFISAFFVWLINPLLRKPKQSSQVSPLTRIVQLLMGLIGGLNLCFLLGMLLVMLNINYWEFFFGMPAVVIALLYLPIFSAGMTTCLPIVGLITWQDKSWSVAERLHYLLTILASGIFIFLLNYWNFLGFRF